MASKTDTSTDISSELAEYRRRLIEAAQSKRAPANRSRELQRTIFDKLAGRSMEAILREAPKDFAVVSQAQAELAVESIRLEVADREIAECAPPLLREAGRLGGELSRLQVRLLERVVSATIERLRETGLFDESQTDLRGLALRSKPVADERRRHAEFGNIPHPHVDWFSGGRDEAGNDLPDRCVVRSPESVLAHFDSTVAVYSKVAAVAKERGVSAR